MSNDVRFWRNVTFIGLAHVAVIYGLIRWSRESKPANVQSIVWMNGGGGGGVTVAATPVATPKPVRATTPPPEIKPTPAEEPEEDRPVLTSAKSDIQLPVPTPTPTATPRPRPSATPVVKGTPKPTPKPIPKPTPKPKATPKKLIVAKASPKPAPTVKPTPVESVDENEQVDLEAEKEQIAKAALEKAKSEAAKKSIPAAEGSGKGTSGGAGGHAAGNGGESQFGWYGSMLHDRFYSEWIQPTNSLAPGAKASALVKIRIEKDGRVSSFEIIRTSGNAAVDESVTGIAKRVTHVDPPPAGLGNGEHYDVKVNFELSSEQ